MKNILIVLFCTSALCLFSAPLVQASDNPPQITVTGEADVRVVPDEVVLTLGVETSSPDLAQAKSENDQRTLKIMNAAKGIKIDDKNIQTGQISIEPRYENGYENRKFVGYFIRKTMTIVLKDTSKFEELFSSVLLNGANYVHGIEFRTTELRKYRDQARRLAIQAAKEKAAIMSGELGQTIGRPRTITEGYGGWAGGNASAWGMAYNGGTAQYSAYASNGNAATTDGSLALGQIKVTASVNITFELQEGTTK